MHGHPRSDPLSHGTLEISQVTNLPVRRRVVVTGASDGIGAAMVRQLHAAGHEVVVVGRSPGRTRAVAAEIGAVHHIADFLRLDGQASDVVELTRSCSRIDVLVNNAGAAFGDRLRTVDGFEKTFQVNHLAPFLLTRLVMPLLVRSRATVVQTASDIARKAGPLDVLDLDHDREPRPDTLGLYAASKLQNILFTRELHRRYNELGISAVAVHPGSVATSFGRDSGSRLLRFAATNRLVRRLVLDTPDVGADRLVRVAMGRPGLDWEPGQYYERDRAARSHRQADDPELAAALWDRSVELTS